MKTNTTRASEALAAIVGSTVISGAAEIRIYSGTDPGTTAGTVGTLLATLPTLYAGSPFSSPTVADPPVAVGLLSGGKFAEDTSIDAAATATCYRLIYNSAVILHGPISELNLSTNALAVGGSVALTSFNTSLAGLVS